MRRLLAMALLSVTLLAGVSCGSDKNNELSVSCIWDHEYSAFPSIVRYQDAVYVSFREGASHIFDENGIAAGKTRILRSTDGKHWESVALLSKEGYDLRDPKLSVTADGRLMVIQGGSVYVDKKLQKRIPQVSFSSDGLSFSDPAPVDYPIPDGFAWFWRMTWHEGTGYTVSYGEPGNNCLELLKTADGVHFEKITDIELGGFPNETTVRFLPDGRMLLLIRREQEDKKAYLGVSEPPFTDWELKPLPFQIGGPEMAVLPDGALLVGGRAYFEDGEVKTCLWRGNVEGDFELWKTLPSGGDNSYPGFLVEDGELKVVYYSSHELTRPDGRPRAGIYLARIPLECKSSPEQLTLLVGTYTDTDSRGIYTFRFDPASGDCTPLTVTDISNPSFLAVTPDNRRVYAVSEQADESAITAFDYNAQKGSLTLLNWQSTLGASSCHVAWTGKNVVASSYSSGSMTVFPLDQDGKLEPGTLVRFVGNGPDSTRQERSHIHSAQLSPDGKFLFVIDLGGDYIYRFPVEDGALTSLDPYRIKVPAGQGPRHFDFSKDGRFLYLVTELEGYVLVYDYNGGDLRQIQMIEADRLHARGSADIHFSPDGKFLYASNRLKGDGLAIFSQDPQTGLLTYVGYQETAIHPRNFTLSPDGRYVLVACRDSDVIQVFVRDPESGLMKDSGKDISVPHPVFVTFTPIDHV